MHAGRPVHGAEHDRLAVHERARVRRPAVAQLVADLRHRVVVVGHAAVGRSLLDLHCRRRHRLDVHPLELALAAIVLETVRVRADPRHVAAARTRARRPAFRVVDAEIRVRRDEVELVAERGDDRARDILRARNLRPVESFVRDGERPVLLRRGREIRSSGECSIAELRRTAAVDGVDDRRRRAARHLREHVELAWRPRARREECRLREIVFPADVTSGSAPAPETE